jgi:hypothetical protein
MSQAKNLARETDKPVGVGFFIPFLVLVKLGRYLNPMSFFYTHMPLTWAVGSDEYVFASKFLKACDVVLGYPHADARPTPGLQRDGT